MLPDQIRQIGVYDQESSFHNDRSKSTAGHTVLEALGAPVTYVEVNELTNLLRQGMALDYVPERHFLAENIAQAPWS